MSLIKRFSDVVRANLNALVDAAEDPEKMLEQSIIEMKEQEQRGKKKLFEITVLYKQALKHIQTKNQELQALDKQAMQSLARGNEDQARSFLAQKQALQERVTQEEEHARGILEQRDALAKTLEQVPGQIASAKKKRDELSKRLMKAKMSGRRADLDGVTRDAKDFVNDEGAFDTFDRMAEKIEGAEAESEALVELAGLDSNLKREQSEKELRKLDVEAALAELKARAEKSPALNEDKDLEEFKKMLKDT